MDKSIYIRPILIGGVVGGILSGLPLISSFNCCCCMWVIVSGALASYLLVSSAVTYPVDGDGALVGLGSGALGGLIAGILNWLQFLFTGPDQMIEQMDEIFSQIPDMPPETQEIMRQMLELFQEASPLMFLFGTLANAIIFGAVGALGGFIGLRIFRPRRFGPYPPGGMPPGYGGWPPAPGQGGPGMPGAPGGYYGPPGPPGTTPGQAPEPYAPTGTPGQPGPPAGAQREPQTLGPSAPGTPPPSGGGKDPKDPTSGSTPPSWGGS